MKLHFIGTGAADFDWSRYGEAGVLGSSSTLIDGKILIDCGSTVMKALRRFQVDIAEISAVVITHNHSDHFDLSVLQELAVGRRIKLYASEQICEKACNFCEVFPLYYGCDFTVDGYGFTALPANHPVDDPDEKTFIYAVKKGEKRLLYALDTANITARALNLIGDRCFDAVVWDATCANDANLWMDFYHSNPSVFRKIRKAFTVLGKLHQHSPVIFSHRARQFWPADAAALAAIAEQENALIPADGEVIEI